MAFAPRKPSLLRKSSSPRSKASLESPRSVPQQISPSATSSTALPSPANGKAKGDSVTVTVRFRPLSVKEAGRGEDVAWYADGDHFVRYEANPAVCYAFDKVFGPAATTRSVYDSAARHVVHGAMQGVNGTVFAYGVTSSGKTHTMHGDKKSPGVIPQAIKDVFNLIQDAPDREFLLRVSYLEIYNEVINDLLDPTGQNLRVREDAQGPYVEGVKLEVVMSPAHALSFVAAGEAHRHVGSTNFNLASSRSHTIFCLTIESSPRGIEDRDQVILSQLNLIDLAGSESSKAETTGLRRKEGSYINRSLLTLGTVISKLSEGNAQHIPYRDSKLTRLLQSSLTGHGRISLICTVTPASGATEETHNTLKFARRAKHVEIKLEQQKIMDEKSLIKKYQKEILDLKEELEMVKRGMVDSPQDSALKQKMAAEAAGMAARLEEEEANKEALVARINRLTKLILVSTRQNPTEEKKPSFAKRNRSLSEDELMYLFSREREVPAAESSGTMSSCAEEGLDDKKKKKKGVLGWLKRKASSEREGKAVGGQSGSAEGTPPNMRVEPVKQASTAGELFKTTVEGRQVPTSSSSYLDQLDLLREQVKVLAGEIALRDSTIKRLSEQLDKDPSQEHRINMQVAALREEVIQKRKHVRVLENRILGASQEFRRMTPIEMAQMITRLQTQLGEKELSIEVVTADNRILQDRLRAKTRLVAQLQEEVEQLQGQVAHQGRSPCTPLSPLASTRSGTGDSLTATPERVEVPSEHDWAEKTEGGAEWEGHPPASYLSPVTESDREGQATPPKSKELPFGVDAGGESATWQAGGATPEWGPGGEGGGAIEGGSAGEPKDEEEAALLAQIGALLEKTEGGPLGGGNFSPPLLHSRNSSEASFADQVAPERTLSCEETKAGGEESVGVEEKAPLPWGAARPESAESAKDEQTPTKRTPLGGSPLSFCSSAGDLEAKNRELKQRLRELMSGNFNPKNMAPLSPESLGGPVARPLFVGAGSELPLSPLWGTRRDSVGSLWTEAEELEVPRDYVEMAEDGIEREREGILASPATPAMSKSEVKALRSLQLKLDEARKREAALKSQPAGGCKLCNKEAATTVLLPCRHLCLCPGCSETANQCPTCSQPILERITTCTG